MIKQRKSHFLSTTLTLLCAAVLLLLPFSLPANADGTPVLSFTSADAAPGDTVTVDLSLSGTPGMCFLEVMLRYDTSALTLTNVEGTGAFAEVNGSSGAGLQFSADDPVTADGVIARLTFSVNEGAADGEYAIGATVLACVKDFITFEEIDTLTVSEGTITVSSRKALPISLTLLPDETFRERYIEGEAFSAEGMHAVLTYDDGTSRTLSANELTHNAPASLSRTDRSITFSVTYDGVTLTAVQDVTVVYVAGTVLKSSPSFYEGRKPDMSGILLYPVYSDGVIGDEPAVATLVSAPDKALPGSDGKISGSLSAFGFVNDFRFNVITVDKILISLDKTAYDNGEEVDMTGFAVSVLYADGTTYTPAASEITVDVPSPLSASSRTVKVRFAGKTGSLALSIADKVTVESISVTRDPAKTSYITGEKLDLTGMVVTAHFSDGTSQVIASGDYRVSPAEGTALHTVNGYFTVTYMDKTVSRAITVKDKITGFAVTAAQNAKTAYHEGDRFDPTGFVGVLSFADGGDIQIPLAAMSVTGPEKLTADTEITFTFRYIETGTDYSAKVAVTVATLTGIKVTKTPGLYEGFLISSDGFTVVASYSDGTTGSALTSYTVRQAGTVAVPDKNGSMTLTVSALGHETTCTAKVATLKSFTVSPSSKTYYWGDKFSVSDFTVLAVYSDGKSLDITSEVDFSYPSVIGPDAAVTASFRGKAITLPVKLPAGQLKVTGPTKTSYKEGDAPDFTGMKVTVEYADGHKTTLKSGEYTVSAPKTLTPTDNKATVTYAGKTATVTFEVVRDNPVVSVEITAAPSKTSYIEGQKLDLAGLAVTVIYADGTRTSVPASSLTVSPAAGTALTTDSKSVRVTYAGKSAEFEISVTARAVVEFFVEKAPDKTEYLEGEAFNPAGMKLTAKYNDGTTETVTDYTTIGQTEFGFILRGEIIPQQALLTFEYNGLRCTQEVTVLLREVESVTVLTAPQKTEYRAGEFFEAAGMELAVKFVGYEETVTVTPAAGIAFPMTALSEEDASVTISFRGVSADVPVTVTKDEETTEATTDAQNGSESGSESRPVITPTPQRSAAATALIVGIGLLVLIAFFAFIIIYIRRSR